MTAFASTGLALNVYAPVLSPRAGQLIGTYTDMVDGWSHITQAVGGYWSAAFNPKGSKAFLDDWYENGIGRDIRLANAALETRWEGFVNKLTYRCGAITATRGPLLDLGNVVHLTYSTVDTTTTPPTMGIRKRVQATDTAQAAVSRALFGTIVKNLSTGGATETNAAIIANAYIADHAMPETSVTGGEAGAASAGEASIQVECLGYVHYLTTYIYNNTTSPAVQQYPHTKIAAILTAYALVNAIFGAFSYTANTAWQESGWENDDNDGWTTIKRLVAMGGTSYARWLFGVYTDKIPLYAAAPTTVEYHQRLAEGGMVTNPTGVPVRPWDVLPGRWIFFPDFLPGRGQPETALRDDPRCGFIESVTFNAPYAMTWQGNRNSSIDQRLARLGLSGIGG